ncbi:hypothetical protein MIC448_630006 [Microbacterium sp. C448]|nr:hypothetical protein MIC448_630006 [Microbacterium sp. C448]
MLDRLLNNGRILAMQPPPSRRTSIMVLGPSRG